jgi:hypothetical protein
MCLQLPDFAKLIHFDDFDHPSSLMILEPSKKLGYKDKGWSGQPARHKLAHREAKQSQGGRMALEIAREVAVATDPGEGSFIPGSRTAASQIALEDGSSDKIWRRSITSLKRRSQHTERANCGHRGRSAGASFRDRLFSAHELASRPGAVSLGVATSKGGGVASVSDLLGATDWRGSANTFAVRSPARGRRTSSRDRIDRRA